MSLGFTTAIGAHSILRKLWIFLFLLYGFPEKISLCLLSLVIFAVHVILLDKILDHIT